MNLSLHYRNSISKKHIVWRVWGFWEGEFPIVLKIKLPKTFQKETLNSLNELPLRCFWGGFVGSWSVHQFLRPMTSSHVPSLIAQTQRLRCYRYRIENWGVEACFGILKCWGISTYQQLAKFSSEKLTIKKPETFRDQTSRLVFFEIPCNDDNIRLQLRHRIFQTFLRRGFQAQKLEKLPDLLVKRISTEYEDTSPENLKKEPQNQGLVQIFFLFKWVIFRFQPFFQRCINRSNVPWTVNHPKQILENGGFEEFFGWIFLVFQFDDSNLLSFTCPWCWPCWPHFGIHSPPGHGDNTDISLHQIGPEAPINSMTDGWWEYCCYHCAPQNTDWQVRTTPTQLLICSSFSRENGHLLLICSSLSTSQLMRIKKNTISLTCRHFEAEKVFSSETTSFSNQVRSNGWEWKVIMSEKSKSMYVYIYIYIYIPYYIVYMVHPEQW